MSAPQVPVGGPPTASMLADWSTSGLGAGMALMNQRSRALADYWKAVAEAREPAAIVAAQLDYWSRMVEDYAAAASEATAALAEASPQTPPDTRRKPA